MRAGALRDEGEVVGGFVQAAEFAQFAVGEEALGGEREGDVCEGGPEVFAEGGGDGVFAEEGELAEGGCVLGGAG